MSQKIKLTHQVSPGPVVKRMLAGAAIGLVIISFFVFTVDEPNPDWGKYWIIRPLIVTPLAAAFGILSFYLKDFFQPQSKVMNAFLLILSTLAFIVALWMGIILGLDGTLWN